MEQFSVFVFPWNETRSFRSTVEPFCKVAAIKKLILKKLILQSSNNFIKKKQLYHQQFFLQFAISRRLKKQ